MGREFGISEENFESESNELEVIDRLVEVIERRVESGVSDSHKFSASFEPYAAVKCVRFCLGLPRILSFACL